MIKSQIIRYWGRKPYELACKYINRYSKLGEIVADTFGGSGIFVMAALESGRRAIYVDLNPFAGLIARSLINGCDLSEYQQAVHKILSRKAIKVKVGGHKISLEPRRLFHIRCVCKRSVEVRSVTFTRIYQVDSTNYIALKGVEDKILRTIKEKKEISHEELCKVHKDICTQTLSNIVKRLVNLGVISEKQLPVSARLLEPCKCGHTKIVLKRENIWTIEGPIEPCYWYPTDSLEYENGKPFLKRRDVLRVNELFMDRSLALLSAIWYDITRLKVDDRTKSCLKLTFMATLARSSKMCRESGGTWPINSYWIPRKFVVKNPYTVFESAANQMIRFLKKTSNFNCGDFSDVMHNCADITFQVADSTRFSLPKNSLDYVIIDPPHTDEAQFFELSLFYTSWLKEKLHFKRELIVNPNQRKNLDSYLLMLGKAARKIHYALKPNKYFTVILHEEDKYILDQSVKKICSVGFELIEEEKAKDFSIYTFQKKNNERKCNTQDAKGSNLPLGSSMNLLT